MYRDLFKYQIIFFILVRHALSENSASSCMLFLSITECTTQNFVCLFYIIILQSTVDGILRKIVDYIYAMMCMMEI
jgi:hypothetical protein